jgi:hypothetical protein
VCACVHKGGCLYVYEYLRLYYISKKIKQEREYTLYYLMVEGSLTKIYNTCMFIYENIQHISVFTRTPNVNDDPVTDNTSSTIGTSATP